MSKLQILAVVGPTASGKSTLALALAERLGGEIVSCDSMQIYRRMDIGTAKPTAEERRRIPHHLIDVAEPDRLKIQVSRQHTAYLTRLSAVSRTQ